MAAQKISFAAEVCFLICLSIYFPLGSAQTFPYISFRGTTHSFVNLSLVGNYGDGSDNVRCHTDLGTCCSGSQGIHRGDWYFPNGTRLPFIGNGTVYEGRNAQVADLRHTSQGESGIYRCDIPTNAVHDTTNISVRDTVYVGLYINGGNYGSITLTFHHYYLFIGDVTTTGIEFTEEEDCCGPFHRFTLTCISTGGPATTVTWTKDSVNITEGAESTYNNITAQYTHTLTLSERVGGFYTCNVSNNKPSFDSSNFTLQGEVTLKSPLSYNTLYNNSCISSR